jgi:hypothetical protein
VLIVNFVYTEQKRKTSQHAFASLTAHCVAAAAEHEQRHTQAAHKLDALSVPLEREVKAAQTIARQTVGATPIRIKRRRKLCNVET